MGFTTSDLPVNFRTLIDHVSLHNPIDYKHLGWDNLQDQWSQLCIAWLCYLYCYFTTQLVKEKEQALIMSKEDYDM